MYIFKQTTTPIVYVYDHLGTSQKIITSALAAYRARWGTSIASNIIVITNPAEATLPIPIILAEYRMTEFNPSHLGGFILVQTLGQLTHYELRQAVIDPKVESTTDIAVGMEWLNNLDPTKPVALDFETAPKLTKSQKDQLTVPTRANLLALNATGLSHPSLTYITHLSIAQSEEFSQVIVLDTDEARTTVLNWIASTTLKQVWHNALFDLYHVYYHTNKFPLDVEDTQLMWATILNHVIEDNRRVSLKHLASAVYKDWAISSTKFELDYMYDSDVIKYAGIDSQATLYLYNEALSHEDFQLTTKPDLITDVFPMKAPKDFNPGRRYFYESVVKPLMEHVTEMRAVGMPLNMDKVNSLRDKLDLVISTAKEELKSNPIIVEYTTKKYLSSKNTYLQSQEAKYKVKEHFLKQYKFSVEHNSYVTVAILTKYNLPIATQDQLPNGKPKYTVASIKKIPELLELPELTALLSKTLSPDNSVVKSAMYSIAQDKANIYNQKILDTTDVNSVDVPEFNPGSPVQLREVFEQLEIPPVAFSKDTGAPSWGRGQLNEIKHSLTGDALALVTSLLNLSDVKTTRTNFVENFVTYNIDGVMYINYKLWGTLSFRPSGGGGKGSKSGFINPLNQPATGSPQAKIVKECIAAPEGRIIIGCDLSSLEDRVIANIANSKAKKDLILDGYDGHLYHATIYYRDEFLKALNMPDDTEHIPLVLEAMKYKDRPDIDDLRQTSKAVTFKLSYLGFPDAHKGGAITQEIFDLYHTKLYPEITSYREDYVIPTTKKNKEIHLLLGASLRTDNPDKDIRSLFNATIQSFSLITLVTLAQFRIAVKQSGYDIQVRPFNSVYDSIYIDCPNDPEIIKWVNDTLIPLFTQQYLEEEGIPNAAQCELGFDLANIIKIPNNASIEEIEQTISKLKE